MSAVALSLALAVLAAEPASPSPFAELSAVQIEARARAQVFSEFDRIGRSTPREDPVLTAAARKLAREAIAIGANDAADPLLISTLVSDANGFDPNPRAVVVRGTPAEYALETFLKRTDFNREPATHVGIGAVVEDDRAVVVALLAERKATLQPHPRTLAKTGMSTRLCGELVAPLSRPELFVTRPSGAVDRQVPPRAASGRFCVALTFPTAGHHSVEVIGQGPRGPEVAALFNVDVGPVTREFTRNRQVEPTTAVEARPLLLARINAVRAAQDSGALEADPRLDAVAQAYADRMVKEGFFAHISPDGSDLRDRLGRAAYPYSGAGENLGLAAGPLAAHFAIEHSPGHRKNLLDPTFVWVGIGVAFEHGPDKSQAIVVEVMARPRLAAKDPLTEAYQSLADRRAARHLPALERSEVLEQIAISHAKRALALDQPKAQLEGSRVHDRVFAALTNVKTASVDFYVADQAGALPDSRSLTDALNDHVGIGAVKGDSPTYGKEKFWVVVIYTASRESR